MAEKPNIIESITALAPGVKSSEFIAILIFVGYLAFTVFKAASPAKAAAVEAGVVVATDAIPAALNLIQNIIDKFGDQTLLGGVVWAYLKRRSGLKDKDLQLKMAEAQAAIERYRAICAIKGAKI